MMGINTLPLYDMSDNPTNCCPRFHPDGWDEQELHFKDKLFVKVKTRSIFYVPINMGVVFKKIIASIEKADAMDKEQFIVLSNDVSPWATEHFFAVTRDVPGEEMVRMTGDYLTKVFEGPYKNTPKWMKESKSYVEGLGKQFKQVYFFYTTCPRCAKTYGKNYVVTVSEVQ